MSSSHFKPGFGLLEVLFATAIFIVVIGSLVALSRLSLQNAVLSNHRIQAVNLAEDGLETVREMRDSNWIGAKRSSTDDTHEWLTFNNCAGEPFDALDKNNIGKLSQICQVDATKYGLKLLTDPGDLVVLTSLDKDGKPQPDPGEPLNYQRTVKFEAVPVSADRELPNTCKANSGPTYSGLQLLQPDENNKICAVGAEQTQAVKVTVKVEWTDFDKPWSVDLTETFTNWRTK